MVVPSTGLPEERIPYCEGHTQGSGYLQEQKGRRSLEPWADTVGVERCPCCSKGAENGEELRRHVLA